MALNSRFHGGQMRRLALLIALMSLGLGACEKKNPNYDPPPPYDGKPASHHKFDGGATDPHSKPAEGGEAGEGGGEAAGGGE
jgi:hypothetical protein